jgi:hypothetical protein
MFDIPGMLTHHYDVKNDVNKETDVRKIISTVNVVQHIFINSHFYKKVRMEIDIHIPCKVV